MRINQILESINKAIDQFRAERNISARGHLIGICSIYKEMGPYKRFEMHLDYVNIDTENTVIVCENKCIDKCPIGQELKLEEKCTSELLTKFFIKWEELKEQIITGKYGAE